MNGGRPISHVSRSHSRLVSGPGRKAASSGSRAVSADDFIVSPPADSVEDEVL